MWRKKGIRLHTFISLCSRRMEHEKNRSFVWNFYDTLKRVQNRRHEANVHEKMKDYRRSVVSSLWLLIHGLFDSKNASVILLSSPLMLLRCGSFRLHIRIDERAGEEWHGKHKRVFERKTAFGRSPPTSRSVRRSSEQKPTASALIRTADDKRALAQRRKRFICIIMDGEERTLRALRLSTVPPTDQSHSIRSTTTTSFAAPDSIQRRKEAFFSSQRPIHRFYDARK